MKDGNMTTVTKDELATVLEWAKEKAQEGNQPPWAFYEYMKLTDALQSIIKGIESSSPTVNLPLSVERQGNVLRLSGTISRQDTPPHRQCIDDLPLPT
jgi:hypothetical protein